LERAVGKRDASASAVANGSKDQREQSGVVGKPVRPTRFPSALP
jgi:hypothetical protein